MADGAGKGGLIAHADDIEQPAAEGQRQKALPVEMGGTEDDGAEEHGQPRRDLVAEAVIKIAAKDELFHEGHKNAHGGDDEDHREKRVTRLHIALHILRREPAGQDGVEELHERHHERVKGESPEGCAEDGAAPGRFSGADVAPAGAAALQTEHEQCQHDAILEPEAAYEQSGGRIGEKWKGGAQRALDQAGQKGAADIDNDKVQWLETVLWLCHAYPFH